MAAEDLALQEHVIRGEITHEEAMAEVRKECGIGSPASLEKDTASAS